MKTWNDELLDRMRQTGDPAADAVVAEIFAEENKGDAGRVMQALARHEEDPGAYPEYCRDYLAATAELPAWADRRRMERGRRFYERSAPEIGLALGLLTLPYCYAAADGAKVLAFSKRLEDDAYKRMQETGQFVWNVMRPHAFAANGPGFAATRQVRLLHATIRHHVGKSPRWDSTWGVPVNQEDQGGTNLAFSFITMRGLRRMHVPIDPTDGEDFLHLWNVVGSRLGVPDAMLPENLKEAYALDRHIARRQFRASDEGRSLTAALLKVLEAHTPNAAARRLAPQYMRFLLGDEVADLLAVPAAGPGQRLLEPVRLWNLVRGTFADPDQARPLPVGGLGEGDPYPFRLPARVG
ncbi:MAG: oxygenase MpaB family protein [Catalinimonas sp.]